MVLPARTVHQDRGTDDLAVEALDGGEHRDQRPARGEDVVDEEHALARRDREATAELATRPGVVADLLGEQAAHPQLARRLEGEDHPAGRRPGDEIDRRASVGVAPEGGQHAAQLGRDLGELEHLELLEVAVAVAAALQTEVAFA